MRGIGCALLCLTVFILAGCHVSESAAKHDKYAVDSIANSVTVTVRLPEAVHISPAARLEIDLIDISAQNSAPLVSKSLSPVGTFPQTFNLVVKPKPINPNDMYVVQAFLNDGDRHYGLALQVPVLTKGNKADITLELIPKLLSIGKAPAVSK